MGGGGAVSKAPPMSSKSAHAIALQMAERGHHSLRARWQGFRKVRGLAQGARAGGMLEIRISGGCRWPQVVCPIQAERRAFRLLSSKQGVRAERAATLQLAIQSKWLHA